MSVISEGTTKEETSSSATEPQNPQFEDPVKQASQKAIEMCRKHNEHMRYMYVPGAGVSVTSTSKAAIRGYAISAEKTKEELGYDPFKGSGIGEQRYFSANLINYPRSQDPPDLDFGAWRCGTKCSEHAIETSGACCAWLEPSMKRASIHRTSCIVAASGSERSGMGYTEPSCEIGEIPIRVTGAENARGSARRLIDALSDATSVGSSLGVGLLAVLEEELPHSSWSSVKQSLDSLIALGKPERQIRELPRITRCSPAAHWSISLRAREARSHDELSSASIRAKGRHHPTPFVNPSSSNYCVRHVLDAAGSGGSGGDSSFDMESYKSTLRSILKGQKAYDEALHIIGYSICDDTDFYVKRAVDVYETKRLRSAVASFLKTGKGLESCPPIYIRFMKLLRSSSSSPDWISSVSEFVSDLVEEVEDSRTHCNSNQNPLGFAESSAKLSLGVECHHLDIAKQVLRMRTALYTDLCYVGYALFQSYAPSTSSTRNFIHVTIHKGISLETYSMQTAGLWASLMSKTENTTLGIFQGVVGNDHSFIGDDLTIPAWIKILLPRAMYTVVASEGAGSEVVASADGWVIRTSDKVHLQITKPSGVDLKYRRSVIMQAFNLENKTVEPPTDPWSALSVLVLVPWAINDPITGNCIADMCGPPAQNIVESSRSSFESSSDKTSIMTEAPQRRGTPAQVPREVL